MSAEGVLNLVRAILEADLVGGRSATLRDGLPRGSVSAHALKITLLAVATHGQEGQVVLTYEALGELTGLSQAPQWAAIAELQRRGLVKRIGNGAWAGARDARGHKLRGNRYRVDAEALALLNMVDPALLPSPITEPAQDILGLASGPVMPSVLDKRNLGMAVLKMTLAHFQRGPSGQISRRGAAKRKLLGRFLLDQGVTLEQAATAMGYAGASSLCQLMAGKRVKAKGVAA